MEIYIPSELKRKIEEMGYSVERPEGLKTSSLLNGGMGETYLLVLPDDVLLLEKELFKEIKALRLPRAETRLRLLKENQNLTLEVRCRGNTYLLSFHSFEEKEVASFVTGLSKTPEGKNGLPARQPELMVEKTRVPPKKAGRSAEPDPQAEKTGLPAGKPRPREEVHELDEIMEFEIIDEETPPRIEVHHSGQERWSLSRTAAGSRSHRTHTVEVGTSGTTVSHDTQKMEIPYPEAKKSRIKILLFVSFLLPLIIGVVFFVVIRQKQVYQKRASHKYDLAVKKIDGAGKLPASGSAARRAPSLQLEKTIFSPREQLRVRFWASSRYASNAWVGIVPSRIPHGSESRNDRHDLAFFYLKKRTAGTLVFSAPRKPGNYDLRMHDTDSMGREVAYISFVVR